VVRDHHKTPVARVCYKHKSCCSKKLVILSWNRSGRMRSVCSVICSLS
jgi:hypothetical protein